jgi:hypothetical protein
MLYAADHTVCHCASLCRAAQEGHAAAKRRLAASQAAIRAHAEELAQAAAAEQERRRQALTSLKSNIDEVRENVGQKADRFRCAKMQLIVFVQSDISLCAERSNAWNAESAWC